jgi:putative glycosyltransferase
MLISVVTTMYYSEAYLEEFYRRAVAAITSLGMDVEFVFVDDGSPDSSAALARSFLSRDERVRVVELTRNYGHHRAIMVGLQHASGDLIFLIDCDLEESPELFAEMYAMLQATHYSGAPADVVYAVPKRRKGGWFERISGALFYKLFKAMSGLNVPANWMTVRLMTPRYVRALLAHRERELFLGGLLWITGFRQVGISALKIHKGSTRWNLLRKLRVTLQAFTAFSDRPLWLLTYFGVMTSAASAAGILLLLTQCLVFGVKYYVGWASVILGISFFGGLNLFAIALVGLYVARVFVEVKHRPCLIKDLHDNRQPGVPVPVGDLDSLAA